MISTRMRVLVLAGLGPYFKNSEYLKGSLFDQEASFDLQPRYTEIAGREISLDRIKFAREGREHSLFRAPRTAMTNLTAATLRSILEHAGVDHEIVALDKWFDGNDSPSNDHFDVVALSTTFLCDFRTLRRAVKKIHEEHPSATIVLGGQFSNLKYEPIMKTMPEVSFVVRGDAEIALPKLLQAIAGKARLEDVPNLVSRARFGDDVVTTPIAYIDLDDHPSPSFFGQHEAVPYESMRGCPFSCKFCSYPAASPKWRHKSAEKIRRDWERYAELNGAKLIRAMDSTFTVPVKRFSALLEMLADTDLSWEAYARSDHIDGPELVKMIEAANCRALSFGFESMSDATLQKMNKKASAEDNLRAAMLLADSKVDYRAAFMVGYPGESPEDYEETHRFLIDRFVGRFFLSVFSLMDETMPVWDDAERFRLKVLDRDEPALAWAHAGMDVSTARKLQRRTFEEARWQSEESVLLLWQMAYDAPLIPELPARANRRIEKLLERLAFLPNEITDPEKAKTTFASIDTELTQLGVRL
jgi:anaerobic magnesium-protoporphyrin IX monomethyl ester cyclase